MSDMEGEGARYNTTNGAGATWRGGEPRPHIRPPLTTLEIIAIAITIAGLLFTFLPLAILWSGIPNTIPTHFNIYGQPNAYGSKATLLIYPGVALGITVLFQVLCRYPWMFNYPVRITHENALRQYKRGRLLLRWVNVMVWLFGAIQWRAIEVARGAATTLGSAFSLSVFVVVAIIVPIGIITLAIIWARRGQ